MIHAYVNYPNSRGALHTAPDCSFVGMHGKPGQRRVRLDAGSMSKGLETLASLPFRADADANDLWLEIDFEDLPFEHAVAEFIVRRLGLRFRPLARIKFEEHC